VKRNEDVPDLKKFTFVCVTLNSYQYHLQPETINNIADQVSPSSIICYEGADVKVAGYIQEGMHKDYYSSPQTPSAYLVQAK